MNYQIIVADGDVSSVEKITIALRSLSHHCKIEHISDGAKLFGRAAELNPDLVILEWQLTNISGIANIELLKSHTKTKNIPLVVVSFETHSQKIKRAFDTGAQDYIKKPFDPIEFGARIKSVLLLSDSRKEINQQKEQIEQQMDDLNRLAFILKHTSNTVIVADSDGNFEWANEAFEHTYEMNLFDFMNKYGSSLKMVSDNPNIYQILRQAEQTGQTLHYISGMLSENGRKKWLQSTITPVFEDLQIHKYIIIETEITGLIETENELKQKNKELRLLTQYLEDTNAVLEEQKEKIEKQNCDLEDEKQRSEKLLLNILPHHVAMQLKTSGYARPRNYKSVSVMFTDFKGFTKSCETLSPNEVVSSVHSYFAEFDDIILKHYIEKIKTIGDAYMCAGGVPLRNKSNPFNVVLAALEIQELIIRVSREKKYKKLPKWQLRIGIHTGAVTAGVVGKIKFAYDIWGDTVNIAKRIESACEVGRVNISQTTYNFIKDYFVCEERGEIKVKNRGQISMFFVHRIRPEFSADPNGLTPNDTFTAFLNTL